MQVVTNYALLPGSCLSCGGTAVPAIDLERDFHLGAADGRVYLCGTCVGAMWSMISSVSGAPGLVPARHYREVADRCQLAETQAAEYREALLALRGESPLTGALIGLAKAMTNAYETQPPSITVSDGSGTTSDATEDINITVPTPPADASPALPGVQGSATAETATAPDGTTVPILDPSTVPTEQAPASETEPFPAPDATTEVPDAEAPPEPADEAPAAGTAKGEKAK